MLQDLPRKPLPKNRDETSIFFESLNRGKSEIISNNYHTLEYHIIKVAKGGEYYTLKNEVEIKDLWKFVVIRLIDLL